MTHKAYLMGMLLILTPALPALAVNPAGYGSAGGEFNIKILNQIFNFKYSGKNNNDTTDK
jgi:hypothetical protein